MLLRRLKLHLEVHLSMSLVKKEISQKTTFVKLINALLALSIAFTF